MTIGERIRSRREELNITQEELATALQYKSRSSINKIELGGNGLTQRKIVDFAKALNTTPSYIMGWEDEPGTVISSTTEPTEKESQMLSKYRILDDIDQGKIDERMDIMLEHEKYVVKKELLNA